MVVQLDVFWKAFILTLVIFTLGMAVGYWIDSGRVEEIRSEYKEMEISSNDAHLQALYYDIFKNSSNFCEPAIRQNLLFSEKVYQEGIKLEKYEKINKLAPSLVTDKRRYVLLKLQFWLNSIRLKDTCDANYTNLVYFYSHYNTTMQENVQSAVLGDLKQSCGERVMLIPLPIDLNITTIDIIKDQYNITRTPTLLINEEVKLVGLTSKEVLEGYIVC